MAKVWVEFHPADLMTKNVPIEKVMAFIALLRFAFDTGRAGAAAQLHVIDGLGDEDSKRVGGQQGVWI